MWCSRLRYKLLWPLPVLVALVFSVSTSNAQQSFEDPCVKPEDCPEIKDCPARCERCTRLETNCMKSMLNKIPTQVLLDSTVFFTLKDNYIEQLDDNSFADTNPVKLLKLDLSKNRMRSISKNALQPLKSLKMLHLDDNLLANINPYIVIYQPYLDFFTLNYNHGLALPDDNNPALYAPLLKTLEINHCNITQMTSRVLEGIPKVKTLDLSYNRIVEFEPETFSNLNDLKELRLEGNPLDCGYVANSLADLCARNVCVTFTCSLNPHGPIRNCTDLPEPIITPSPPIWPIDPPPQTCIVIHPVFLWLIVLLLASILLIFFYWSICKKFNLQQHPAHRHHHHRHDHSNDCHNRPLACQEREIEAPCNTSVASSIATTPSEILTRAQVISISETKSPQTPRTCISSAI